MLKMHRICPRKLIGVFKFSSPIAQKFWYTLSTEREAMRKADAVEIFADNPTVSPVTRCFAGKRTKDVQATQLESPDFFMDFCATRKKR